MDRIASDATGTELTTLIPLGSERSGIPTIASLQRRVGPHRLDCHADIARLQAGLARKRNKA